MHWSPHRIIFQCRSTLTGKTRCALAESPFLPYIEHMRQVVFSLVVSVVAMTPAFAQETDDSGMTLMERGAQLFMEGIMREMEPAFEDLSAMAEDIAPALREFADQMGPALTDMLGQVEDWSAYEAPEVLPNGDIIIRRKPGTGEPPDLQFDENQQIEI